MSSNSNKPPMMESCAITSMHITTLGRPENGAEISFQSTFKGIEANGKPWGIEVTVKDVYKADTVAAALQKELGPLASVRTWMDMNANLFAALKLEKIGMFILLAMVVLIGSFSIVTTLVMLVMEKTHDIAILMSMGFRARSSAWWAPCSVMCSA